MELRVGNKYRLGSKIGSGTFGDIYLARNIQTNEEVAVKLENIRTPRPQLMHEARVYRMFQNHVGFPIRHWYGVEGQYNFLVMDLLGPSVEDLFRYCGRQFSLKTVLLLAMQLIKRLETLHSKDILHRDIKPENFLIGLGTHSTTVFLVDFGLAKRFIDRKTGLHLAYCEGKSMVGTVRYASLNALQGIEQSRRDDLESLAYVLVYLMKGSLPWQGIRGATLKEKCSRIAEVKRNSLDLCETLPTEFATYLNYCRGLGFEEVPDYSYLEKLFRNLFVKSGYADDTLFDWILTNKVD